MRSLNFVTGICTFSALIVSVGVGCSSSSNKSTPPATDGSVPSDSSASEEGGEDAAMVCTTDAGLVNDLAIPNSSEAGVAALTCEKTACASEFTACAADSCCNATFIAAFICLEAAADGGSTTTLPYSVLAGCFANVSMDTAGSNMLACLIGAESACGLGDGGKPATDASDASTPESDSTAPASDAGDGAVEQ
jgi:hypothetical protein